MSVTRTFTVTVANPGAGNRYYIDGVLQATVLLGEGGTYRFDQSAGSNGGHPFKFSTTSNGTHGGGSEYTTGVTYNGTPGQAGAYTQIIVADSAPQLYYYCQYHSGMGGQADTVDADSYGIFAWNINEWGSQSGIDVTLTGLSTTSSVGSVEASNIQGWGRQSYGNSGWGVDYAVQPTGQLATTVVGSVTAFDTVTVIPTGLEAETDLGSLTTGVLSIAALTGVQAQTELGTFDNAGTLVGWGRNGWGEEPYGDSFNKLVQPAGLSSTSSVGSITATPETIASLTGLGSTSAVGSLSFIISPVVSLTGQSALSIVGDFDPAAETIGLTGQSATSAVGSITPADVMRLTGQQINSQVGNLIEATATFVTPTGVSSTSSVGSIIPEIGVPLTGVSATASVGTITPADIMGLTGQEAVSSVGELIVLGYVDVNIVGNTNYSDVDVVGETSYTDVTHVAQENKIMASTYTDLGLELMATGENAGTWGTKTNANLSLIEQLTGGVLSISIAGTAGTQALTIADGALTGTAQHRILEFTGTISGNRVITFPLLTETFYIIKNGTTGSHTVQLKAVSGSGATVTFATGDKGYKLIYLDGVATNTGVFEAPLGEANEVTLNGVETLTNKTLTAPKIGTSILDTNGNELFLLTATGSAVNELTYANAATGNKPSFTATGGDTNIGVSIQPKGSGTVTIDALTFPAADGSADQILTTNGSGVLSFVDNSGGTSWAAVKTGNYTASAGEGVFANTTSGAWTLTLPAGTLGDEISFIDYAGTFDSNALTIAPNGSEKIQGVAASLTVSVERAANTLVYTDGTQGWLLKNKQ